MSVGIDDIRRAQETIANAVVATPFTHSRTISGFAGCHVALKFENQQFTGSFKDRGAFNKLSSLGPQQRAAGIIAMSAGNHAQGVAYHARNLDIPATIVMPNGTPFVKINSTEVLGAEVLIEGANIEDAAAFAHQTAADRGLTFVHPYDDALVIAGQGTVGLEILAADPDIDTLVVPIGGGGLISGIAIAAKAHNPAIKIYGVEAARCPSMRCAVQGGEMPDRGATIADGIAVKVPGGLTKPVVESLVEDVLLVNEAALERAILLLLEIEKTVAEGAGAAGMAAVMEHKARFAGRRVGVVITGGNIDPRILSSIILSGLVREGRITRLRVTIPDRPGNLARVAQVAGAAGANILEVSHQRAFSGLSVTSTALILVLETRNMPHAKHVMAKISAEGYVVETVADMDPAVSG